MTASTVPRLPFAHLNLRRNPFGELSIEEWTAIADVDLQPLLPLLNDRRAAIQFIGDKGCGKTTHLLAIRTHCQAAAYVHLPEGERSAVPIGSPLLIDEAQRLTLWQRRQLFRSGIPLVLGTHRDFETALRRAGRDVNTVRVADGTNPERLQRLLNARIAAARRQPGNIPTVSLRTAEHLLDEFGPNVRCIVHEMYGRVQRLQQVSGLDADWDY